MAEQNLSALAAEGKSLYPYRTTGGIVDAEPLRNNLTTVEQNRLERGDHA